MENIEIPPFYVGQEVIAIMNHSQDKFKKGDEFKITSIHKSPCGLCNHWTVNIGIICDRELNNCPSGHLYSEKNKEWSFKAISFRPKIELTEFISMKEVTEKAFELISGN